MATKEKNDVIARFTVFEDSDGYWFAPSPWHKEADPKDVVKPDGPIFPTKISACRAALKQAVQTGASELHLNGVGSTTSIIKEAKLLGITPFIYHASIRSRIAPYIRKKTK